MRKGTDTNRYLSFEMRVAPNLQSISQWWIINKNVIVIGTIITGFLEYILMKKKSKKTDKPSNTTEESPIPIQPTSFSPRSLANNTLVHIACIVFLILIIYSNALNAPFQWDEGKFIVNNPIIKDLHYFASPSDAKGFELYSGLINRYIGYLTFALNYRIHGLSVTGYHIINIAIHIANSILVYFLVLLTFKTPFMASSSIKQHSRYIALFSSLLFASHPLQTEAVTYVFQRFASLMAFFYLLSLTAYIQSRLSGGRSQRFFYYSIAFISVVLAMKTKENAFTLPVVITLFEFCFLTDSIKKKMFYLAPILLTLAIIPLVLMSLTGIQQLDPGSYGAKVFSQGEYFFTQFRVIITYLRLLFFPVNQNILYDYPVFKSFFDLPVFFSFAFLALFFGLGVYMIIGDRQWATGDGIKTKDKEDNPLPAIHFSPDLRVMGFGILWFFITLSVESSIIPIPMLIDEYRVYLPSVGLIITVVAGAFLIKKRVQSLKSGKVIIVSLVLVLGVLSIATYHRNGVWGDEIRLWEDTAKKSPRIALAHNNLGVSYQSRNMYDKAMEHYLIAIKLSPDSVEARNNLEFVSKSLNMAEGHYNLGIIYQARNMYDKAMEHYLIAIKLKPDYAEAHNNLGSIYQALNMPDKAMEHCLIAINLRPNVAEMHFNLGVAYYKIGQMEKAQREFITGLKIKPDDQRAQQLLREVAR